MTSSLIFVGCIRRNIISFLVRTKGREESVKYILLLQSCVSALLFIYGEGMGFTRKNERNDELYKGHCKSLEASFSLV